MRNGVGAGGTVGIGLSEGPIETRGRSWGLSLSPAHAPRGQALDTKRPALDLTDGKGRRRSPGTLRGAEGVIR